MNGFDIILLAMVAAFVLLRLRSELGNKSGSEPHPPQADGNILRPIKDVTPQEDDNVVVDLTDQPALRDGYGQIRKADPSFDPSQFLDGAEQVYPMILNAFWAGDKSTLEQFLSEDVFGQFEAAIDARADAGQRQEGKVLNIARADIIHARQHGAMSEITVEFEADLSSVTFDTEDQIVAGSESDATTVKDIWTFAHNARSEDPNWVLVATRTA